MVDTGNARPEDVAEAEQRTGQSIPVEIHRREWSPHTHDDTGIYPAHYADEKDLYDHLRNMHSAPNVPGEGSKEAWEVAHNAVHKIRDREVRETITGEGKGRPQRVVLDTTTTEVGGVPIQQLADEAERGHDPASIRPVTVVERRHLEQAAKLVGALSDTYGLDELRDRVASALARAEEVGRNQVRGGIRVLRIIEYIYPTVTAMAEDMKRWQIQGDRQYGRTHIRSTSLPPEVLG